MTEERKKVVALAFIRSLQTRDMSQLRSVLTDDAVWSLPGISAVGGEAVGADAIVARGAFMGSHGVHFELLRVLYRLTDVAIILHNTAQQGDGVLDEYLTTVLRLKDSKIDRVDTYISDVSMLNRFAAAL